MDVNWYSGQTINRLTHMICVQNTAISISSDLLADWPKDMTHGRLGTIRESGRFILVILPSDSRPRGALRLQRNEGKSCARLSANGAVKVLGLKSYAGARRYPAKWMGDRIEADLSNRLESNPPSIPPIQKIEKPQTKNPRDWPCRPDLTPPADSPAKIKCGTCGRIVDAVQRGRWLCATIHKGDDPTHNCEGGLRRGIPVGQVGKEEPA